MATLIYRFLWSDFENKTFDLTFFFYRFLIAITMIFSEGIKRLPIGGNRTSMDPNPFGFSQDFNQGVAFTCTFILPLFVIAGLAIRLTAFFTAILPLAKFLVVDGTINLEDMEVSVIYFISFLLLVIVGGGKYSIDNSFAETIK